MPTQIGSWTAKNIFYSDDADKPRSRPITVKSGEDLAPGQVMGRITATDLYVAYDPTATDGSQIAAGILAEYVNTDTDGLNRNYGPVNLYVGQGLYKTDALVGMDANALRHLGGSAEPGNLTMIGFGRRKPLSIVSPSDAAYTVPAGTDVVLFPSAAAARTITLPPLEDHGYGNELKISTINANTNNITLDGDDSETINGAATFVMSGANQALTLLATASGWRIVS